MNRLKQILNKLLFPGTAVTVISIPVAAALVSMLSLETAMLTQFGDANDAPYFKQAMNAATGGAVCVIILGMAVFMTLQSTRQLKKLQNEDKSLF